MLSDPLLVVARLAEVFDRLSIPYVVGGSLASSVYGIPRATQDVDVAAGLDRERADAFADALAGDFYIDAAVVREAIRRRASFNVIHLDTMFKADVFIAGGDEWSREEMARARVERLDLTGTAVEIRFASPEDILLHKLLWYERGDRVSDRQWTDVLGVLKVQAGLLDQAYLDRWAGILKVSELLVRARAEARIG